MNAKVKDKIFTVVLYIISTLVVLLLAALIGYILIRGVRYLTPSFLFGNPKVGEAGGGIGPQFLLA